MFDYLFSLVEKRKSEKRWLQFYTEVSLNWENWHVMHQRNVLEFFPMVAWAGIQHDQRIKNFPQISVYVQKFTTYNQRMSEFKDFEQWYGSDIKNKITENARLLHGKKEAAAALFKDLLAVVDPLKKELEIQLRHQEILKS